MTGIRHTFAKQAWKTAQMVAAFSCLALTAAACAPGHDTAGKAEPTDPYLKTAAAEWDSLFNARDAAKLAALYTEDALSMPVNAPTISGRQALQAEIENFFSDNTGRHETVVDEILATGEWAIERAHYTLTFTPTGGPEMIETGRHVMCRKKVDGRWLIAWEIWNTDT